jgi:hypothetical protein
VGFRDFFVSFGVIRGSGSLKARTVNTNNTKQREKNTKSFSSYNPLVRTIIVYYNFRKLHRQLFIGHCVNGAADGFCADVGAEISVFVV